MLKFLGLPKNSQLEFLSKLDADKKARLLALLREYRERAESLLYKQFPDEGEFKRELYVKHLAFFKAGATYRERLFMAGNRVGKTRGGCTEDAYHLTGLYPHWWEGRRFDNEIRAWIAGKTNETTRDILQRELFGKITYIGGKKTVDGTGLIPRHCIGAITWKSGVNGLIDTIQIRHVNGEWSELGLKSYQQGRGSFEGTAQHLIHLDEEPPQEVYTECLMRTATTNGIVIVTFTPLEGTTEMVDDFVKKAAEGVKFLIQAGWADAPHLSEETRAELLRSFPKHEHEARTMGIPYAGSGLIFPVDEASIICDPFEIPKHWVQIGGMDFGWDHPTTGAVLAWDRDEDVIYLIGEYTMREKPPEYHARHLLEFKEWLPWSWPHDGLQHDKGSGEQIAELYRLEGLNMLPERATHDDGTNSVEAGLMMMLQRMEQGKFKVFKTCTEWLAERRMYHRKKGKIVKQHDDIIDASRYALMMIRHAMSEPSKTKRSPVRRVV